MQIASAVMPNGSGVGVKTAVKMKLSRTTIRHQPSIRFAVTSPTTLSISMINGNSKPIPNTIMTAM